VVLEHSDKFISKFNYVNNDR